MIIMMMMLPRMAPALKSARFTPNLYPSIFLFPEMIIMIILVTMTHQDDNKDVDDVHDDNNYDDNCDDNDVRTMIIDYGGDNALDRC